MSEPSWILQHRLVSLVDPWPGGMPLGATQAAAGAQLGAAAAVQGRAVLINSLPGVVSWREDGTPLSVLAFTVLDGRIAGIAALTDPARLASLDLPDPG